MSQNINLREIERKSSLAWKSALLHAVPISLFVLALFYYWFVIANRYSIFLYEHLGATPFDRATSSRYWMAGLVASGMVMVLYTGVHWLLGRIAVQRGLDYRSPAWGRVWALCVPPLVVGIPIITMTWNWPTLPSLLAAACVVSTLIGLALALMPGQMAARRPVDLAWLIVDGAGLVPTLLFMRTLELPGGGIRLAFSEGVLYLFVLVGVLGGAVWLIAMTVLRSWRCKPFPGAGALLAAGFCLSYLLLPMMHYLFGRPMYLYISASTNLFASNIGLQLVTWIVATVLAVGTSRLRQAVQKRSSPLSSGASPLPGGIHRTRSVSPWDTNQNPKRETK